MWNPKQLKVRALLFKKKEIKIMQNRVHDFFLKNKCNKQG